MSDISHAVLEPSKPVKERYGTCARSTCRAACPFAQRCGKKSAAVLIKGAARVELNQISDHNR